MVKYQERSRRGSTGNKIHSAHKKRKSRLGRNAIETKIDDERKKIIRTRGGNIKIKAYSSNMINVSDLKKKKTLEENKASVDYNRRNILTKGAIVKTKLGLVKITSRPGQTGQINGKLLEK
ncbi:MAG: 30S ribosomal protein S8e [Promethearchaeota archaeon]